MTRPPYPYTFDDAPWLWNPYKDAPATVTEPCPWCGDPTEDEGSDGLWCDSCEQWTDDEDFYDIIN